MKKLLLKILCLLLHIINILNYLWFPLLLSTFSIIGLGGESIGDIMLIIYTYIIFPICIILIIYYIQATNRIIKIVKQHIEHNITTKLETKTIKTFIIISTIIFFLTIKFFPFLWYSFLITSKLFFKF